MDLRRFFPMVWPTDMELQEDEWRRRPYRHEPEFAIGQVYEAAPRPRWTKEPPIKPGMYFCRVPGQRREAWKVYDVYRARDGRWVAAWTDTGPHPIPREGLEWTDRPITEPRP